MLDGVWGVRWLGVVGCVGGGGYERFIQLLGELYSVSIQGSINRERFSCMRGEGGRGDEREEDVCLCVYYRQPSNSHLSLY